MSLTRNVSEHVARNTSRRGLLGRGAELLFGAVAGAAAGTIARGGDMAIAGKDTICEFPGPPCSCANCQSNGVCSKPCVILTTYYASGCWVSVGVTCCDCNCTDIPVFGGDCGCGSDYHNDPEHCP